MSRPVGINSKGHFKVRFGSIFIPHLDYEVHVKPIAKVKDRPENCCAFARNTSFGVVELYFAPWVSAPTVAHECMHAVQFICSRKRIDAVEEMEHAAYLLDYLIARVLGYSTPRDEKYA
jgi:hypothetical protein